jgi:hypothetical protein
MQRLRNHSTGANDALQGIPEWPARGNTAATAAKATNAPGIAGSLSERHAEQVWTTTRHATSRRAPALIRQSGPDGIGAMVALEFIGQLAAHIARCPRCQQTGRWDTVTPAAWLLWALGKKPQLAAIMRPVLAEAGTGLPPEPPRRRPAGRTGR